MLDTPQSPGADDDKRFQSCGNARRLNHNRHQCSRGERLSLAGLVSPQSVLPGAGTPGRASQVFALYAAARTIPLALFALVAIYDDRESNFRSVATAREAPRPYGYPIFVYIMHIAASGRSAAMNLVDPSAGKIGKRR